jgi:RNA polymerase sigma factor (sigma-70 family)
MILDSDTRLLEQIRSGDAEAGCRFVREHYPGIYHYLLYLTGQPELAADLTQETFLQAWRHLDTFEGRASLRTWLHRIARREFLQALRSQRAQVALEETAEISPQEAAAWLESVELREVIDRLPLAQREVVLLHYLEGYSSTEIARIVEAPVGTVCYRLARARERLRQALGEDDLTYLNEPLAPGTRAAGGRQWHWLPLDQIYALEARLALGGKAREDLSMERREFLRQATASAVGLVVSELGKEVVDSRLTQKATLAFKGTALSDLCDHLRTETGVHVTAGVSVADEKVTLFCEKTPLREVMRQLSRPFGYTWLRSGTPGQYRYELVQDLRSQLLEEELRNRDRNAALLALDKEIERYRPYLDLSPDEALEKAKMAPPPEKKLLENLAGYGWGPIQMYFRLSNQEQAALRAGQKLIFSQAPEPGEQPLPPELVRGVLQSFRGWYVHTEADLPLIYTPGRSHPDSPPLAAVPELRASIDLTMTQSELGEYALDGYSKIFFPKAASGRSGAGPYASGRSPAVLKPDNRAGNLKLAGDPVFRPRVTVQPQSSCHPAPATANSDSSVPEPRVTPADVLENLHQTSGLPIVADYYTRLYKPAEVSLRNLSLFEALNQLADTMHLRWRKDADRGWLQFRSASYYDDRLKEVPNRLLERWSAARRQRGSLRLDELVEIAQLSDAQLDAKEMAEGAQDCFGLAEWILPRHANLRPHLRYLATFTPDQRRLAMSTEGIPFIRMSLAQQQQFFAFYEKDIPSLQDLQGATLRIDYSQPGGFQWGDPDVDRIWARWVVIVEDGPEGRWVPRPSVRERTREAVMQAVLRLDPKIRERAVHTVRSQRPTPEPDPTPLEAQIFPTKLSLTFLYFPAASNALCPLIVHPNGYNWQLLH